MKTRILSACFLLPAIISTAQTNVINIDNSGNVGIGSGSGTPLSYLDVSGSYGQKVTTITTGTTLLDITHNTIVCNNGSTPITITIPNAAGIAGRVYIIKKNASSTSAGTVTLNPITPSTLDGQTSLVMNMPNQALEIFSDGTNWLTRQGGLSSNASAWSVSGNAGTAPSIYADATAQTGNFLGTTDNLPLEIFTNSSSTKNKTDLKLYTATSPTQAISAPVDIFHIRRNGETGVTYPLSASFALGKYNNTISSETELAIKVGNANVYVPDVTVMTLRGNGNVGIGSTAPLVKLDIAGTDAIHLPNGTTAQRPTGVAGYLRFNNNSLGLEYHDGTQWVPVNMEQTPIGTIVPFAGPTIPAGWLLCDGQTPLRTGTYAALFAAIGTTWGAGNGSTTFHIPDLRGRFPRGVDGSAGRDPDAASRTASNAGGNTANALGSVQADANIAHTHSVSGTSAGSGGLTTSSNGDHTHSWGNWWSIDNASVVGSGQGDGSGNTFSDGYVGYWNNNFPSTSDGDHNHSYRDRFYSEGSNYTNGAYGLASEFIGTNFRGSGDTDDDNDWAMYLDRTTGNGGTHSHNVYLPNHRHWIQARNTTTTGAHTHTIGDHTHTFSVTSGAASGATSTESRPENAYVQYIIKATSTSTVAIVSPSIPNGTNGQTLRYNSGSGLWVANSFLYNDESSIGIGTSAPAFKLDMPNSGTINARLGLTETGAWPVNNAYAYWGHEALDHSAQGNYALLQHSGGNTYINSATGTAISFRHNNADQMILNSGRLGVGTTNPEYKIESYGTAQTTDFTGLTIAGNRTYAAGQFGTVSMNFALPEGAGGLSSSRPMSIIRSGHESATTSTEGFLSFYTRSGGVVAEKVRINSAGNMGIGSNAPLSGGTGTTTLQIGKDLMGTGASDGQLILSKTNSSGSHRSIKMGLNTLYDFSLGDYGGNGSNTYTEHFTVKYGNGNVGIGVSDPTVKLDVSGTVKATKFRGDGATRPAFSVWQSGMGNPGAGAVVTYNSTILNQGSAMNLGTGYFTAPVAGLYHFTFSGFKQSGAGTTSIVFWVNGANQGPRSYNDYNLYSPVSIATTVRLAAGGTVAVYVESGSLHGNANNQFSGFLIAED